MSNLSCQVSVSQDGYFIVIAGDVESMPLRLRYIVVVAMIASIVTVAGLSILIFVSMALTSKLRTAVDIVFSQIIISTLMLTTVNWSYRSYLIWRVGSLQNTAVCVLISLLRMSGYLVVLISYLLVAVMQLIIVKRGVQTFHKVFTRRVACLMSAATWMISSVVVGLSLIGHHGNDSVFVYEPLIQICGSKASGSPSLTKYLTLSSIVWTTSCLAATSICYAIIIRTLKSQVRRREPPRQRQSCATLQLSSRTRQRIVKTIRRITALISIYIVAQLPIGIVTGLILTSCTSELHVYKQIAHLVMIIGVTAFFPAYILAHRLRRRACYLLLTGNREQIAYSMWHQHVTSACDTGMWRCHVTLWCDTGMWNQHVTLGLDVISWHQYTTTVCDTIMQQWGETVVPSHVIPWQVVWKLL